MGLPPQVLALQVAVSNLQATVKAQGTQITNLQTTVKALKTSNNDLSNRLQYVSLDGQDMYITGANLHILSGSGGTDGTNSDGSVNGLGNLIVGYNESRVAATLEPDDRTGSHNIVVGGGQNFSSYGGLIAGHW